VVLPLEGVRWALVRVSSAEHRANGRDRHATPYPPALAPAVVEHRVEPTRSAEWTQPLPVDRMQPFPAPVERMQLFRAVAARSMESDRWRN